MVFTTMNELSTKYSDSVVMSIIEKLRRKLIILFSEQGLNDVFLNKAQGNILNNEAKKKY